MSILTTHGPGHRFKHKCGSTCDLVFENGKIILKEYSEPDKVLMVYEVIEWNTFQIKLVYKVFGSSQLATMLVSSFTLIGSIEK